MEPQDPLHTRQSHYFQKNGFAQRLSMLGAYIKTLIHYNYFVCSDAVAGEKLDA